MLFARYVGETRSRRATKKDVSLYETAFRFLYELIAKLFVIGKSIRGQRMR
jgi:hypothetical protein